jgi:hypothetical protein
MSDRLWPLKHALKQPARRLHARLDRLLHRPAFTDLLGDGEAAAWIEAALIARQPVLVGRLE